MSLLKWKELAKQKSELGNKINLVHDTITNKRLGEEKSQLDYEKMFKPITSKLDEVNISNLMPIQESKVTKSKAKKKMKDKTDIDYYPEVDPYEEMDIEGLIDEDEDEDEDTDVFIPPPPDFGDEVSPQEEKQIPEDSPPEYTPGDYLEETERKALYEKEVFKSYDLPIPEENIGKKSKEELLETWNKVILNIGNVKTKNTKDLKKIMKENSPEYGEELFNKLQELKNKENSPEREEEINILRKNMNKVFFPEIQEEILKNLKERDKLDLESNIITLRRDKLKKTGKGLKTKKGGNVTFYNDPKELLKKLELIVGSIIAGNTNIEMYNIGIAILDVLLKTKVINKSQHEKIYKNYFKQ